MKEKQKYTTIQGVKFPLGKTHIECDTPECREYVRGATRYMNKDGTLKSMLYNFLRLFRKNRKPGTFTVIQKGTQNTPYILKRVEQKTNYLGIASLIIVLFALLIIANEALGNPLLEYLTR